MIFQFDVFGSHRWIVHSHSFFPARFILALLQCGMFVMCLSALRRVRVRPPALVTGLSVAAAVAVVLGASIRADLAAPYERPVDYQQQMALREAALALPPEVQQDDDVVLVKWEGVRKSHLYVRFWGGVESLEVGPACPLEALGARQTRATRLFARRFAGGTIPSACPASVPAICTKFGNATALHGLTRECQCRVVGLPYRGRWPMVSTDPRHSSPVPMFNRQVVVVAVAVGVGLIITPRLIVRAIRSAAPQKLARTFRHRSRWSTGCSRSHRWDERCRLRPGMR